MEAAIPHGIIYHRRLWAKSMSETKQTTLATNMANWPLLTLGIIGLNVLVYLSIFRESTPGYPDINPTRLY